MATTYNGLTPPADGEVVDWQDGRLVVPDRPIIPFIEGDGTGPDIWRATRRVLDGAVAKTYGGKRVDRLDRGPRRREGQRRPRASGCRRRRSTPSATTASAIKGPLTTPVGGGIRSLNVALRQILDLYACVRPVRYFDGVPSPVKEPEKVDMVIFRENTEDVYAGIEWPAGSAEAKQADRLPRRELGQEDPRRTAASASSRSRAFGSQAPGAQGARVRHRPTAGESVTLVHKGNIMKFTEGAFKDWGYEVAREEFGDAHGHRGRSVGASTAARRRPASIVIKDRIADAMFQQVLLRPDEYDVLATTNLNGDYLSDALAAQVGGLGMAPGSNEGDGYRGLRGHPRHRARSTPTRTRSTPAR